MTLADDMLAEDLPEASPFEDLDAEEAAEQADPQAETERLQRTAP